MGDTSDQTLDVAIWNEGRAKSVTVTTDGLKERLDVDAKVVVTNNESPTKYQLRTDYDATGDSVGSGADVVLFSFTGSGVIDFIGVNDDTSSNFLVAIEIDGTERLRISMADLGVALGMAAAGIPIYTETANKMFRYVPTEVGFTTGFKVIARATTGTRTLKHVTLFRERIV